MAIIKINFTNPINASVQTGDSVYYSIPDNNQGGFNQPTNAVSTAPIFLGIITLVDPPTSGPPLIIYPITVNTGMNMFPSNFDPHTVYIFFSKDNTANMTSLAGYYAKTRVVNNSTTEGEIFAISSDYNESSR